MQIFKYMHCMPCSWPVARSVHKQTTVTDLSGCDHNCDGLARSFLHMCSSQSSDLRHPELAVTKAASSPVLVGQGLRTCIHRPWACTCTRQPNSVGRRYAPAESSQVSAQHSSRWATSTPSPHGNARTTWH
jgi:hypothetical protein